MKKRKILISGAMIADGTGSEPEPLDVLVKGEKILVISNGIESEYDELFDAKGLIVAPGFIDIHTHGEMDRHRYAVSEEKLAQGCTTEVLGNCGVTTFPFNETAKSCLYDLIVTIFGAGFDGSLRLRDYFDYIENRGIAINAASLVGQGTVRAAVMGMSSEAAGEEEHRQMGKFLKEALDDGAVGISTGLVYPPGSLTRLEELTRFMELGMKMRSGKPLIHTSHIRDEGKGVRQAIDEVLRISKESGIKLEISHIKCLGRDNWGRSGEVIEKIETARKNGIDVTADIYPYTYASTILAIILSFPEVDDMEKVFVCNAIKPNGEMWEEVVGKSIVELSDEWNLSVGGTRKKILTEAPSAVAVAELMLEEDVINFLKQPWTCVGSDGMEDKKGKPHPRVTGTFPRILARYVREKNVLSWGEAIAKMTGNTAKNLGLEKRGLLKEGYFADITFIDPEEVKDNSTYKEPHLKPSGIPHVLVNGEWALKDGEITENLNGKVLRF